MWQRVLMKTENYLGNNLTGLSKPFNYAKQKDYNDWQGTEHRGPVFSLLDGKVERVRLRGIQAFFKKLGI